MNALTTRTADLAGTSSFAAMTQTELEWLWHGRILYGDVTGLVGAAEVGKGHLWKDVAARVSRGWPMPPWQPDDPLAPEGETPGHVLISSLEENVTSSVLPRLKSAGADLNRCHDLSRVDVATASGGSARSMLQLPRDFGEAGRLVDRIGDVRLWIIDPLMSAGGTASSSGNAKAREQLIDPLRLFAERTGIAVLLVNHFWRFTKKLDEAKDRMYGSKSVYDALRAWTAVWPDPDNAESRMLISLKGNEARVTGEPPRYRITGPDGASYVEWQQPDVSPDEGSFDQLQQRVMALLVEAERPVSIQEVAAYTRLSAAVVRQLFRRAQADGQLQKVRGAYQLRALPAAQVS